jgi:hypothetical protein
MHIASANVDKRAFYTPENEEDMVIGEHQSSDDESVNQADLPKEIHLKASIKTVSRKASSRRIKPKIAVNCSTNEAIILSGFKEFQKNRGANMERSSEHHKVPFWSIAEAG